MGWAQVALLGVLQGLTEFLPVSSSAHLALAERLFGLRGPETAFDVALHGGTLLAVLLFFRKRLLRTTSAILRGASRDRARGGHRTKLLWALIVGTLPAGFVGVFLGNWTEALGSRPIFVGSMLVLNGLALLSTKRVPRGRKGVSKVQEIGILHGFAIGLAQAAAVLRGISRSGATITAGLHFGLSPEAAVEFSFLLFLPVVTGAIILELPNMAHRGGVATAAQMAVGAMVACVTGYFALWALLNIVRRSELYWFAPYCIVIGLAALLF